MFKVSEPITTPPAAFASQLQQKVYETFAACGIPFERVDTDPGLTMEDCQHIDAKIGVHIVKTIFLCNRQQTAFYLYVTTDDKPFVTRDFCAALGIPRVSFAPADKLWELTGVPIRTRTTGDGPQRRPGALVCLHRRHRHLLRQDPDRRPSVKIHPGFRPRDKRYRLIDPTSPIAT